MRQRHLLVLVIPSFLLLLLVAAWHGLWRRANPQPAPSVRRMADAKNPPQAARKDVPGQAAAPTKPGTRAVSSPEAVAEFSSWTDRYLDARPEDRPLLEAEGAALAAARRPVFKQLIKDDPKAALENAVPMVVRQNLPWSILRLLEERVNGVGVLRVLQGVPMPGEPLPSGSLTFRETEMKDGKTYRAYVYGRRLETVTWTPGASLNGVAVDSDLALNEQPSRTLEVGEVPPADKPAVTICPVSGKQVFTDPNAITDVITEDTPAVETATETVYFCSSMHIDTQNQTMIMGEGVSGGAFGFTGILPAAPAPSLGTVKVLVIPMTYADQNAVPSTEAALYAMLRDVSDFYSKASYGRLTLTGVVTPPVKLKHNEAWYINRDTSNGGDISGTSVEHAEAREEARKLGFDSNDYDCIGVRHSGGPQSYGGLGGGSSVWCRNDSPGTWAHEIGHCFGLAHANFWNTAGSSSIGNGINEEYGHSYDIMGTSGTFPNGHYNVQAKSQIKWLPSAFVTPVTESGVYRIHAFDQGALDPTKRYAMTILKDAQRTYWGQVQSLFETNPWVKNGLVLGWRFPGGGGGNLQLIDTTNGSPFSKEDAPISLGSTFSDTENGIHMTTVAVNDSPRYVDVQVNMGAFPTNQKPTLTLTASADVVPTGATVVFTAAATDPDGDTLAYSWQNFGDTSFKSVPPNAATMSRTFTTAGTYIVTCTVSDMKGGTATRNQLITVGNGNSRYTITGRVTLLGAGLQDVVITANGANGVVTDADGYYTIPNLAANTYTLTPLLYGYSFGELFNNSITVGPNFTGADFEASAQSTVTISAATPTASELSPVTTGKFTITRTGDTSQALAVSVNTAQGTATKGTDYAFSPDYVTGSQGFSTFTIPADAESLDVVVTPVVDSTAEGPETVTLQLGPGASYLVSSPSAATVTITDDDTALPKISVAATTPSTLENAAQPAAFTISRTGATTSALIVNYALSGTATSGPDFAPLSGTVTIPAGASASVINVTPANDAISESSETVTLTLSTSAADYIIDPTATRATADILDDDQQVVTVAATDPIASEKDLTVPSAQADTGTFVLTRSGDISSPLTVYYAFAGSYGSGVIALHGVDYEALPGSIVIPAGQTSASITIMPRFDTIGEGPEQVVLYLGANATNYIVGSSGSATVTINDAVATDKPYVDVVNTGVATEGGGTANFRITVRGSGTGTLAVNYSLSGTASAADYAVSGTNNTLTGTTITMNNGTVTRDVTITATNDTEVEDIETLTLTLTADAAYQLYPPTTSATMSIKDNDSVNTVYVDTQVGTSGSSTVTENSHSSAARFYISRTGATTSALTVNYTLGGTATAGVDYDNGAAFSTPSSGIATTLRDVWGLNTSNIWAVGDGGVILKWNGSAWTAQSSGTTANLLRVWGSDANNVWAVGASGTIRKWNGTSWGAQTSGTTNTLRSVWGNSATSVWAVGDVGTILKWNGTSWSAQTSGTTSALNGVWVSDASNAWVVGTSGLVRFWNGTSWAAQTSATSQTLSAIWGSSTSAVWAAGASGTIQKWNGTAWTLQTLSGSTSTVTALSGSDASNVQATVGTGLAAVTSDGGATGWQANALPIAQAFNGIWRSSTGDTWAVGGSGSIVSWNWSPVTAFTGSITIPAGALGVDLNIRALEDAIVEGTETITFDFASGSYSRSPGTVMYIADNDTPTATVGFASTGSAGSESVETVNIPVTLSAPQAAPVTVDYAVSGTNTSTTANPPVWVRIVKTGTTITHFTSDNGSTWVQQGGAFTVNNLGNSSYLAGIAVGSGSSVQIINATVDNFSVTGLSAGGSTGAETFAALGNSYGGTHSLSSGVYTFTTTGTGMTTNSTSDNFRFVYVPVSNSANCTVTARVLTLGSTNAAARVGVSLRSSTAQGSVYAATLLNGAAMNQIYTMNRTTTNGSSNTPAVITPNSLPMWFRLTRSGDVFSTAFSRDNVTWISTGPSQTTACGPSVLAGLVVSGGSDGDIATATFENVTLDGSPVTNLAGRTVGFVNEQGTESVASNVWTLSGSGAGIGGSSDEGHFAATSITGDFTLVARVTSLNVIGTSTANGAQAGVMMRQTRDGYSRSMYAGYVKSQSIEQRARAQSATSAFGSGVDFSLAPGRLTFLPGETSKNITLSVVNDAVDEPDNLVTIQLSNAAGAGISATGAFYGYTILDDDNPPAMPYVGFAAVTRTVAESAGTVNVEVSLSSPAAAAVSVAYAVTGGTATAGGVDFTFASGTLNFAAGESVKTFPLTIVNDASVDADETIVLSLSNPVAAQFGTITDQTITITDDDLPVVTIVATDPSASEAGLDQGVFTFYRTGDTSGTLNVTYAASGTATSATDRQGVGTSVTFAAGSSTATRLVIPLNDAIGEATETTTLTLTAGAGYAIGSPSTATVFIFDDDRSIVSLVANDPTASESGGSGQFSITRTAPFDVALAVTVVVSGTATNGTDYQTIPTTVNFSSGQSSITLDVIPNNDLVTEGDEQVTLSLSSGSYDLGASWFDNVTIADNDSPPTLFINSPNSQGPLLASGNGIILSATITDDGAPAAVTQTWSLVSGPGSATIESPDAATTAVTFSAPGTYVLRITATDTQFTVSDQVTIVVGSALEASDWITQDLTPSSARRGQGLQYNGLFTVTGTGAGYASQTTDRAHVMVRQVSGDGTIIARLTSLPNSGALGGVTIRDSMARGARRAVLGFVPGSGLQFRTRTTVNTADTLVASDPAAALPLWIKLERNATTGAITAGSAPDSSGTPGTWTQLGTATTVTMDSLAEFGLTTTSNSSASTATAIFDNVSLTPSPSGPALLSDDAGTAPSAAGSGSFSAGTYTISGSPTGFYYGWQYYGDMVVTARLATFTSGAGSASGGIRIAESMESGGQIHLGRMPQSAYNGYYWTSIAGGTSGGVPSSISAGNWMKLVRRGNSVTAYRASDVSGSPGSWLQIGQPQTIIMTTPVWVGFYVDNSSGVGMNTCTFTNFSITPLNKAPIVDAGTAPSTVISTLALDGTVTDDSLPAPVSLTTQWIKTSGPAGLTFGDASLIDTNASFTVDGSYKLRLLANDGGAQSFDDVLFNGYTSAFAVWQGSQFAGGSSNPSAAMLLDPDNDGMNNLLEYALGTDPKTSAPSNVVQDTTTVSSLKYLRLTVTKNTAATDVTYEVQATGDLTNPASWTNTGLVMEMNTPTQLIVRDNVPAGPGVQRFMRVLVTR
ncbi:MAG: PKD domain-containing protein [Verrucomicrobiaceae bacterium]|nr:PKD domain-containing protein [Verrucomicrobiaceae bacterium]